MNVPTDLTYSPYDHWVRTLEDGTIEVGITEFAQDALGDIVYVQLPTVGKEYAAEEACAIVESAKTASDIHAPVSGKVTAINEAAEAEPSSLNEGPYNAWLFKMIPNDMNDISSLLTADQYLEKISS